jgi:hypothetical protein
MLNIVLAFTGLSFGHSERACCTIHDSWRWDGLGDSPMVGWAFFGFRTYREVPLAMKKLFCFILVGAITNAMQWVFCFHC